MFSCFPTPTCILACWQQRTFSRFSVCSGIYHIETQRGCQKLACNHLSSFCTAPWEAHWRTKVRRWLEERFGHMHKGNHPGKFSLKCHTEGHITGKPKPVKFLFWSFTKKYVHCVHNSGKIIKKNKNNTKSLMKFASIMALDIKESAVANNPRLLFHYTIDYYKCFIFHKPLSSMGTGNIIFQRSVFLFWVLLSAPYCHCFHSSVQYAYRLDNHDASLWFLH